MLETNKGESATHIKIKEELSLTSYDVAEFAKRNSKYSEGTK
jgi:hypothetical protein